MESNQHMRSIAQRQATLVNHQVMMAAPTDVRERYFGEIYKTIHLETENRRMQQEVLQLELLAKRKKLEKLMGANDKDNGESVGGNDDEILNKAEGQYTEVSKECCISK